MTDKEKKSLIHKISIYDEFLRGSSGFNDNDVTIADLIKDDVDYGICETFVVIHLINGECITLRNHCYESFMEKRYSGDLLYVRPDEDCVDINCKDSINNDYQLELCRVPLSSIIYIHSNSVYLNWLNLSKFNKMIVTDQPKP